MFRNLKSWLTTRFRAKKFCSHLIIPKPIITAAGLGLARARATITIFTLPQVTEVMRTIRAPATSNRAATRKTTRRCSAKCFVFMSIQPRAQRPFRRTIRSLGRRRTVKRFGRSDCGIHFGTVSIDKPAECLSAMSGKTRARKLMYNNQRIPVAAKITNGDFAKERLQHRLAVSVALDLTAVLIPFLIIRIRKDKL